MDDKQVALAQASLNDLLRRTKLTSDIRFQAAHRLTRRQRGSTFGISLLSLFVIALSLLPNILKLAAHQNQILLACSVVLSSFIIFTSILDGTQNFSNQAETLRGCARAVDRIYVEAKLVDLAAEPNPAARVATLTFRYLDELAACPIDHEPVDYLLQRARESLGRGHGRDAPTSWLGRGAARAARLCRLARAQALTRTWGLLYVLMVAVVGTLVWLLVIKGSPWVDG